MRDKTRDKIVKRLEEAVRKIFPEHHKSTGTVD